MKTNYFYILLFLTLSSCVSKQVYQDLEAKYNDLLNSNATLVENNEDLVAQRNQLKNDVKNLEGVILNLNKRRNNLESEYTVAKKRLSELISSYEALQSESSSQLTEKAHVIQDLLLQLEAKENTLADENRRLQQLQATLNERSKTIDELEGLIQAKEAKMNALRTAVSRALENFEGKGLSVTHKNGKVYVSMENKLLFDSGSWRVGSQGASAIKKLAKVLVKNTDIEVLIEGHTDNVPYTATILQDNWDLSVKRATAIVRILQNQGVNPKQLTASGRSKYLPIEENTTSFGRAKNRRIEIILAPNLDKITQLLGEE